MKDRIIFVGDNSVLASQIVAIKPLNAIDSYPPRVVVNCQNSTSFVVNSDSHKNATFLAGRYTEEWKKAIAQPVDNSDCFSLFHLILGCVIASFTALVAHTLLGF